jgi:hypothetical protein
VSEDKFPLPSGSLERGLRVPNNDNFGVPALRQLAMIALLGGFFGGVITVVILIFAFLS